MVSRVVLDSKQLIMPLVQLAIKAFRIYLFGHSSALVGLQPTPLLRGVPPLAPARDRDAYPGNLTR